MKLEVGKAYRTRDGRKVTIKKIDIDGDPLGCNGLCYHTTEKHRAEINGRVFSLKQHPADLIAEWTAADDARTAEAELDETMQDIRASGIIDEPTTAPEHGGVPLYSDDKPAHPTAEKFASSRFVVSPEMAAAESRNKALRDAANTRLRDEFAMAALTGMIGSDYYRMPLNSLVRAAFECADAMMAERAKAGAA